MKCERAVCFSVVTANVSSDLKVKVVLDQWQNSQFWHFCFSSSFLPAYFGTRSWFEIHPNPALTRDFCADPQSNTGSDQIHRVKPLIDPRWKMSCIVFARPELSLFSGVSFLEQIHICWLFGISRTFLASFDLKHVNKNNPEKKLRI